MSIGKTRGFLYKAARILGDVDAVQKGRMGKRIAMRAAEAEYQAVLWRDLLN